MLAYSDESGSPGVAINKSDWFLVSMAFFKNKTTANSARSEIVNLRKKLVLPVNYEFHHIDDPKNVQIAFYNLIKSLDFEYKTYAIKKNNNKKFCSETTMANLIVSDLGQSGKISVIMDKNKKLYNKLCKSKKILNIDNIHFAEEDSKRDDCLQIVDYIACHEMSKLKKKKPLLNLARLDSKRAEIVLLKK